MNTKIEFNKSFKFFGTFLFSLLLFTSCTEQKQTLKDAYSNLFYIGTALNQNQILGKDSSSISVVREHFNSITAENDMKWEKIHPQPAVYDFAAADSFVNFGEANNMFIIGHCLVWHAQTPSWVFEDVEGNLTCRDTLLKRLHDHILTVVGRYKGRVNGWDVVNEAISDTGGMRQTKWMQIIGDDYIEKAFEYAREADSTAELYYNDYSLTNVPKRETTVQLIKSLQNKGIKVDGIGEQGHFTMDFPTIGALDSCITAFEQINTKVMITELDLTVIPFPTRQIGADISMNFELKKEFDPYVDGLPDSVDFAHANRYADFFKVFVKHSDAISRVTLWGVNDAQSWRNYWPIFGRTDFPLLFDRNNQPKKAVEAIISCNEIKK